jgi:cell division protein FtsQ
VMHRNQKGFVVIVLLLLLALGVTAWVSVGITTRDRWPIRWLEVQGSFDRVSAERLRASLLPLTRSSFFTLKIGELSQAAEKLPWVSRVTVQKRWPDTVIVTVEEHQPVAHWNHDSLVSAKGEIFRVPEAAELQGLPWLTGQDQRFEEVIARWNEYNGALAVHGLEIARLEQDKRGSWEMTLDNSTHIRIGRDSTQVRLARLLESWPVLLREHETPPQSVDLRYTNGIAVNWTEPDRDSNTLTDS